MGESVRGRGEWVGEEGECEKERGRVHKRGRLLRMEGCGERAYMVKVHVKRSSCMYSHHRDHAHRCDPPPPHTHTTLSLSHVHRCGLGKSAVLLPGNSNGVPRYLPTGTD